MIRIAEEIAAERRRQVARGYDAAHDDAHAKGELAQAAAGYALCSASWQAKDELTTQRLHGLAQAAFPWIEGPRHGTRATLIRAAAIIVAEIERLDRVAGLPAPDHGTALEPDRFWTEFGEHHGDIESAVEEADADDLTPVEVFCAVDLAKRYAVRLPYTDETAIKTFPTRNAAESYIAEFKANPPTPSSEEE